jgi:uncharacterized protein (DUF1499 family)
MLKQYLSNLVSGSNIIEKVAIRETVTILWYLKKGINKEESENYLNEVKKSIKNNFVGNVEFKVVEDIESIKEEICYERECSKE